MELRFRKATIDDLECILEIYRAGVANMQQTGIDQWDETYPAEKDVRLDISRSDLYLCMCDGEIAAVYAVNTIVDPEYNDADWQYPDIPWCAMHRLCVSPDFHRRGIATAVMKNIESQALSEGFGAVHLDTFSGNHRALGVYQKLGYKEVGEAHWAKGRFVIMEKKIDPKNL